MQRFEAPVGLSIARLSAPQPSPFHVARPRLIHLLDDAATLPLTLVTGAGAAARNSIGLVLVGGMAIGSLFTLFIIPSIYMLVAKDHSKDRQEKSQDPAGQ